MEFRIRESIIYFLWLFPGIVTCRRDEQLDGKLRSSIAKIVGGSDAEIGEFPWQISLQRKYGNTFTHICGGSIISDRYILTAKHCISGMKVANLQVRAGITSLTESGLRYAVRKVKKHKRKDLALLRTSTSIALDGTKIAPVELPPQDFQFPPGTALNVTGWGTLVSGGSSPDNLQSVELEVVSYEACDSAYAQYGGVASDEICAGSPNKDSCQGDSGGPLMKGRVQVGIVSWGIGCAHPDYPGVNVKVSSFVDWIRRKAV